MIDLQGKKTYIVAALAGVATVLKYLGYLSDDTFNMLVGLFGAGGMATMAAKSNRIDKKLIIFLTLMILPSVASAQTTVTQGPITTTMKFAWDNPSNLSLPDAPTFEYRIKDLTVTTSPVVVLTGVQCSGATLVSCTAPVPQAAADMLNKVGSHGVALALFRTDVGESGYSLPFGLPTPAGVPTGVKIIK